MKSPNAELFTPFTLVSVFSMFRRAIIATVSTVSVGNTFYKVAIVTEFRFCASVTLKLTDWCIRHVGTTDCRKLQSWNLGWPPMSQPFCQIYS
jgi:hypothetical protein